jgi:hypothetical protein
MALAGWYGGWRVPGMSERLDAMVVEAASPDRQVEARLSGEDVDLWFVPHAYRRFAEARHGERELAHQLARLAALLWVAYRQGYQRIVGEATGTRARAGSVLIGRRRDFRRAQAELVADGRSSTGLVTLRSVGLVTWDVTIGDGTLRRLSEEQFVHETRGAARTLLDDHFEKTRLLKDRHFGLDLAELGQRR